MTVWRRLSTRHSRLLSVSRYTSARSSLSCRLTTVSTARLIHDSHPYERAERAIMRGLGSRFPSAQLSSAVRFDISQTPVVETAKREHSDYHQVLVSVLGSDEDGKSRVLEAPECSESGDSIFIEDCLVVNGKRCLITRLGHSQRRVETSATLRDWLHSLGLFSEILDMNEDAACVRSNATIDGGDVLQMPDSLPWFIGVGNHRSNEEGLSVLRDFFGVEASSVNIGSLPSDLGILHLKSMATWITDRKVVIMDEPRVRSEVLYSADNTTFRECVEPLWVSPLGACNVVRVRGHCVMSEGFKDSEESVKQVCDVAGIQLITVDNTQLRILDSALSCLSVLV